MIDTWLIFLIHKELLKIDKDKPYILIEKWAKQRKEEEKGEKRGGRRRRRIKRKWPLSINKYSILLIIRKTKTKTSLKYHSFTFLFDKNLSCLTCCIVEVWVGV